MKKTLALVLALVMVLALVPMAFAKTITVSANDKYTAEVKVGGVDIASVESLAAYKLTDSDSALVPAVKVTAPYKALAEAAGTGLWDGNYIPVDFAVDGFYAGLWACTDLKATVDGGVDVGVNTIAKQVVFKMKNLPNANATYTFTVTLTGKDANGDTLTETMKFTFTYTDTTKPVYQLKFGNASGAVLKDGVYFIDSAFTALEDPDFSDVEIFKNDGSKFSEIFYWSANDGSYVKPLQANKVSGASVIKLDLEGPDGPDDVDTYFVNVETEYAFYQGKISFKYRNKVERIDPKGISFEKDTYTIGVHEILTPKFNTVVPVYHNVADFMKMTLTANSEKNVIDVDGLKITGLKEGTAYVVAEYTDHFVAINGAVGNKSYTATAKIIVKGTYQVQPNANYIVTTAGGSLNVRAAASTSAAKLGTLKNGTKVEVTEIKNGWAKIITANFTNAYVSAAYLTKEGTAPVAPIVGEKTVICRVLNVRAGAGTSYAIVGKLTRNAKVEVIETVAAGKWAKISYNGAIAYVSTTYIQ